MHNTASLNIEGSWEFKNTFLNSKKEGWNPKLVISHINTLKVLTYEKIEISQLDPLWWEY